MQSLDQEAACVTTVVNGSTGLGHLAAHQLLIRSTMWMFVAYPSVFALMEMTYFHVFP